MRGSSAALTLAILLAAAGVRAQDVGAEDAEAQAVETQAVEAQAVDVQDGPAEDPIGHGTRQGKGDSRGPGAGDGTGRPPPSDDLAPAPPVDAPDGASKSSLAFTVGDGSVTFVPSMQYRLRYFHDDGRDFLPAGETDRVRHRARLGLSASYDDRLTTFIQLQDARSFGEESDPSGDFSADGFDLHQGYLQLGGDEGFVRLGRQEMNFSNERLLGVNQYAERARSFDGARAVAERGGARLDVGWALVRDFATNAEPVGYGKRHVGAADLRYELAKAFVPDVFVLFEGDTESDLRRVSAGGNLDGRFGGKVFFDYHAEAWIQYGNEAQPLEVTYWGNLSSFLLKATVDLPSKPFVYVEATFVSGDDDPTDDVIRTFTQPYPRGHRVLGQMDYFLNFRRDTDERGLRDLSARVGWKPFGLAMDATVHLFDSLAERPDQLSHYGWELDFRMRKRMLDDHLGVDAVYAFFVPGELIAPTVTDPSLEHFAYIILDSKF
jgi:Alginate export